METWCPDTTPIGTGRDERDHTIFEICQKIIRAFEIPKSLQLSLENHSFAARSTGNEMRASDPLAASRDFAGQPRALLGAAC